MVRFQNILTEMGLSDPTKIAKTILLCWTQWPSELKLEKKSLNDISS